MKDFYLFVGFSIVFFGVCYFILAVPVIEKWLLKFFKVENKKGG